MNLEKAASIAAVPMPSAGEAEGPLHFARQADGSANLTGLNLSGSRHDTFLIWLSLES